MRISQQLGGLTVCAIGVIVAVGATSFFCVDQLTDSHKIVNTVATKLELTQELLYHMAYATASQRAYIITGKDSALDLYRLEVDSSNRVIGRLREQAQTTPDERALAETLERDVSARLSSLDTTLHLYETKGKDFAFDRIKGGAGLAIMAQTVHSANNLTDYEKRQLMDSLSAADGNSKNTESTIILGSLLAIAIISGANLLFSKSLSSAVTSLLRASQNTARDRYDMMVDIKSNNELGDLARAFNALAGHLKEKSDAVEEHLKTLKDKEAELETKSQELELAEQKLRDLNGLTKNSLKEIAAFETEHSRLSHEIRELCVLSESSGMSLQQALEKIQAVSAQAESAERKRSDLQEQVQLVEQRAEDAKKAAEETYAMLPRAQEFMGQMESLSNDFGLIDVVSSLSAGKNSEIEPEMKVLRERLQKLRDNFVSLKGNLNVSIRSIDQRMREVVDASTRCCNASHSTAKPADAAVEEARQFAQSTKTVKSELRGMTELKHKYTLVLADVIKRLGALDTAIEKQRQLASDLNYSVGSRNESDSNGQLTELASISASSAQL